MSEGMIFRKQMNRSVKKGKGGWVGDGDGDASE